MDPSPITKGRNIFARHSSRVKAHAGHQPILRPKKEAKPKSSANSNRESRDNSDTKQLNSARYRLNLKSINKMHGTNSQVQLPVASREEYNIEDQIDQVCLPAFQ